MSQFQFRAALPEDAPEIEAFNARMAAAGHPHRVEPAHVFEALPDAAGGPIVQVRYLCLVDGRVRGAVSLREQSFSICGGPGAQVAFFGYPLSEGIIAPDFAMVGMLIQREVLRRYPLVYGLGAGSLDAPVAQMMTRTGWSGDPVPFHFKVVRAAPFLREARVLRSGRRGAAMDLAAATGLGAAGLAALQVAQGARGRGYRLRGLTIEPFTGWEPWADHLWQAVRGRYTLIGDRSVAALKALYPAEHPHIRKVRVTANGRILGWVAVSVARLSEHRQFGNLMLGALVDMLAAPEDAAAVIGAGASVAEAAGADLVVMNNASPVWSRAAAEVGLLSAATNYFLFQSPKLRVLAGEAGRHGAGPFFTRGDGDGPVHLW
jgi:hypothetical protein